MAERGQDRWTILRNYYGEDVEVYRMGGGADGTVVLAGAALVGLLGTTRGREAKI